MFHERRTYQVSDVPDSETLAEKLTQYSWTLCTAFRLGDLLFVNDASSEDGAGEWLVVKGGRKWESITFGSCTFYDALKHIEELVSGRIGEDYGEANLKTDHGTVCRLCA